MRKKKTTEEQEEHVSKWILFKYSYKTNPGFKALVKLCGYFIFFIVIISVASFGSVNHDFDKNTNRTTEPVINEKNYHEMLDDFRITKDNIKYTITLDEEKFLITSNITSTEINGIFETKEGTTKFAIKDNQVYEIRLDEYIPSPELFSSFNIKYINPVSLIDIISDNKATKMLENDTILYNYDIENAHITVTTQDSMIKKIIIDDIVKYEIVVEKKEAWKSLLMH